MCEMSKCLMDEVAGHTAQSLWIHLSFECNRTDSGCQPHLHTVPLSGNTALATLRILDLTRLCSHMQAQQTGLDGPAGGSLPALKPIKATWVCVWPRVAPKDGRARATLCAPRLRGGQEQQAAPQD